MQTKLQEAQSFAATVFQWAADKGEIESFMLSLGFVIMSSPAPIDSRYHVSKQVHEDFKDSKEPFYQLYPEVLEYRPPREVVPVPACFIHCLPDHLLLTIFEHYLYDEEEDNYRTNHAHCKPTLTANLSFSASPMILFSVCKRWRNFCNTPSLWTSLAVYKPRRKQICMITLWLERSAPKEPSGATLLISLYLHDPPGDQGHDESATNLILRLFMEPSNTERMKHLTIKLSGDFPIPVPTFDAPYLHSVELDIGGTTDPTSVWLAICGREPKVQKVSWKATSLKRPTLPFLMPWELLTHLKLPIFIRNVPEHVVTFGLMIALVYCTNLVNLEIAILLPDDDSLLYTDNYNAERQVDSLRRLRAVSERDVIYQDYADLIDTERNNVCAGLRGPIDLPRLRHLKIEAHGRRTTLLNHLIVPSLCSLEILHCTICPLHRSTDSIISLLQRSQPPLTSLSLFDPQMTKAETLKLVSLPLTELRQLELYVAPVGNQIMRALTITPETRHMPNLRKLVLPECAVSNGHMAEMVASRLRESTLKELRMSLPPARKTKPEMRKMLKEQYQELSLLKELASGLTEEQFVLVVD
ncbi:hypothetical protein C0992_008798 [Termitomyces sp. T32_za158]|nr:hypothetical protein C0992_008798 [Termitomyces sp. T32_za158]